MSVRLNPILPATPDLILVGDPRRAFALGQALTVQPEMSHLSRGLWGYRGTTEGGLELTVQSTGVGGPSAVAVLSDLIDHGARRIVRLGTCSASGPDYAGAGIHPGRSFLVSAAHCADGAGLALNSGEAEIRPDPELFAALEGVAEPAEVISHDLVRRVEEMARSRAGSRTDGEARRDEADDPPLRDLQTAATLACAKALGVQAAAVLVVAEDSSGERLEETVIEEVCAPLGLQIVRVLESLANPQPEG
jgi:purine-nucleoside phosphorylase